MDSLQVSEILRNYALLAAAFGGVGIAYWRAIAADRQSVAQEEQVQQTRREHVIAIFAEAVERLDADKLHVRLGAIYTLREIVDTYPDLSRPVVDLLTAYLSDVEYGDDEPPLDVREIMRIVVPIIPGENKE